MRYRGYVQYIMGLDRSVELGVFFWMMRVEKGCGVGGGGGGWWVVSAAGRRGL